MAAIRQRLPSQKEALLLFVACAFVVNFWSYINLLRAVPSLLGQLSWVEILKVVSYVLAFALLESILVFIVVIIIGMLLPQRAIRDDWVAHGAVIVMVVSLWIISFHYFLHIIPAWNNLVQFVSGYLKLPIREDNLIAGGLSVFLVAWILGFVFLMLWLNGRINRVESFASRIHTFVDRLFVLTFIYVVVDLFFGVVVAWRFVLL